MEKKTYIPILFRFPAFKKSQHEQSENDGHVIISEKEKHKININQMWEILTVTKIPWVSAEYCMSDQDQISPYNINM